MGRGRELLPDGLTLVPGIELSCQEDGRSLHMLGYLFDPEDPALAAELARICDDRVIRAQGMVDRLRDLGVDVTWGMVRRSRAARRSAARTSPAP